jgi:hypothetical protein
LELNSQVVKAFQEFTETDSVVEVNVEESEAFSHSVELFLQLCPQQVNHPVEFSSLLNHS